MLTTHRRRSTRTIVAASIAIGLVGAVQGYQADDHKARAIVRVHIRRLRQKIEADPDQAEYVLNVRGVGYVFASEKAA